jgi:hypothetical protein
MYPVHCPLKDFDLDRFLNVNLMFATKLADMTNGDHNNIAVISHYIAEFEEFDGVRELKEALKNGKLLFLMFHERFSIDEASVLCVDGEMEVSWRFGGMEDHNYGFLVQLTDEQLFIHPYLLIDPDHKKTKEVTVEEVEHCGQFDARMTYFLKGFRIDQQVKEHMMAGI